MDTEVWEEETLRGRLDLLSFEIRKLFLKAFWLVDKAPELTYSIELLEFSGIELFFFRNLMTLK